MRASAIDWIQHGNMPINSVDVQPRGYRILTGGSDNKVCIWNLLPIISRKFEQRGGENINLQRRSQQSNSLAANNADNYDLSAQKCFSERKNEINQDGRSQQCDGTKASIDDQMDEDPQISQLYENDVAAMESLFDKEEQKSVRKLAELSNHEQPVNCVRWNNIGTFFASGGDDGRAILWEFKGHKFVSKSQDIFANAGYGAGVGSMPISQEDFKNQDKNDQKDKILTREDWQAKKIWRNHQCITDLTWAPDSLHFATCGTDSRICIMNINEGQPLKILETKANGLTFDPFGKFMASQSSEEKCVKIWRVQNFKNITEETQFSSYYKQSMGMSINRRLSWSSDGTFISTTGGRIQGEYVVPLIERSSWNLVACLAGHSSSINISRINPRLYRAEGSQLNCYSIVAIVSQDSTISIWKPQLSEPFALMMDFCMMGVTDLSWGFNGNILFSSSHDGKVTCFHFQPGILGTPLQEYEKRDIISRRYGNQVLQEYIKNSSTSQQKSNLNQLSAAQAAQQPVRQEQKTIINAKTGKKKIMPKIERIFDDTNAQVNPHLNPFIQLSENLTQNKQTTAPKIDENDLKPPQLQNSPQKIIQQDIKLPGINEINKLQQEQQQERQQIPQDNKVDPISSQNNFNQLKAQAQPASGSGLNPIQIPALNSEKPVQDINMNPDKKLSPFQQVDKQNKQNIQEVQAQLSKENEQSKKLFGQDYGQQDAANALFQQLQMQKENNNVNTAVSGGSANNQIGANAGKMVEGATQMIDPGQYNREFLEILKQIYDTNQELTAVPLSEYQALFSELMRDEIQIILPKEKSDMFSEELRILIQNIQVNAYQQKIELKIFNCESTELSRMEMSGERVMLVAANKHFFAIYTNKQLLHVFSSTTTELIKRGILIEGVCMIDTNVDQNEILLLTLKGRIIVYRIENPDYPSIDSLQFQMQTNIQEILSNIQSQHNLFKDATKTSGSQQLVHVQTIKLLSNGNIDIFLSNNEKYQYERFNIKQWRKLPRIQNHNLSVNINSNNAGSNDVRVEPSLKYFEENNNQNGNQSLMGNDGGSSANNADDLSKLIGTLDKANQDENMTDQRYPSAKINADKERLVEMQDIVLMYQSLELRNEFINSLRNYTLMIFEAADLNKIKDLLVKYSLINATQPDGQSKFYINQADSLTNFFSFFDSNTFKEQGIDSNFIQNIQKQKRARSKISISGEKKYCGYEQQQIFNKCIMPALQTICENKNLSIIQLVEQLISQIASMAENDGEEVSQEVNQQSNNQIQPEINGQQIQDLDAAQPSKLYNNAPNIPQQNNQQLFVQDLQQKLAEQSQVPINNQTLPQQRKVSDQQQNYIYVSSQNTSKQHPQQNPSSHISYHDQARTSRQQFQQPPIQLNQISNMGNLIISQPNSAAQDNNDSQQNFSRSLALNNLKKLSQTNQQLPIDLLQQLSHIDQPQNLQSQQQQQQAVFEQNGNLILENGQNTAQQFVESHQHPQIDLSSINIDFNALNAFCRQHHIDLQKLTDQELQQLIAHFGNANQQILH